MSFFKICIKNKRSPGLFCFMILSILCGQPGIGMTADATQQEVQRILHDSLEDIWTGREFSPDLKQQHKALKTALSTDAVNKAALESMIETTVLAIMDRQKTSRYILNTFPERVPPLFSPHLNWEEIKTVIWRTLSSVINKDDPIFMKVGTMAPPGTPWLSVPETTGLPEIDRLSDGKVQTKIYGGGVMGEDTDVLKKMADGQLDTCGCTALGVLEACPEASVLLQPGLFKNYAEVDFICKKFRETIDEAFEKKGNSLLALIDTGYFYLFSVERAAGLTDLRMQKIITWFGTIETTLYQELGINPVSVAVPDTISAFSTGKADTIMAPAAWMLGMQAYQYVNYYIKSPLIYSPAAVIVSGHMKDRIQEQTDMAPIYAHNLMELLIYEWRALETEWKRQIRSYEEKSLKAFETKCGMKAVTFSPEDLVDLEKASKTVQQKLAGEVFPKGLIGDIQQALKEYRSAH